MIGDAIIVRRILLNFNGWLFLNFPNGEDQYLGFVSMYLVLLLLKFLSVNYCFQYIDL